MRKTSAYGRPMSAGSGLMPNMRYASAFMTAIEPSLVTARTPFRMLETMSRKKRSSTGGGIGARRRRTGLAAAEERPRDADCRAGAGDRGVRVCNGMGNPQAPEVVRCLGRPPVIGRCAVEGET